MPYVLSGYSAGSLFKSPTLTRTPSVHVLLRVTDWYGPYAGGATVDPQGPPAGEKRVIRGGSWFFDANSARCALRETHAPADRGFSLGFRVAAERRR